MPRFNHLAFLILLLIEATAQQRPAWPRSVEVRNLFNPAAMVARDALVEVRAPGLAEASAWDLVGAEEILGVRVWLDDVPQQIQRVEPARVVFALGRRGSRLRLRTAQGEELRGLVRVVDAWPAVELTVEPRGDEVYGNLIPLAMWHVGERPGQPVTAAPIPVGPRTAPTRIVLQGSGWRNAVGGIGVRLNGVPCRVGAAYPSLFRFLGTDELVFELPQEVAGRGPMDLQVFVGNRVSNPARLVIGDAIP